MTPSLLLVPSARKSGKLYSVLPIDGSGDLTFTRASTAIETNGSNLLSSVASGVPRLDYTDSTCPKLLLEPARTNLLLWSQDITNAIWTKTGIATSISSVSSIISGANYSKLTQDSSNGQHRIYQTTSLTSGNVAQFQFIVKRNDWDLIQICSGDTAGGTGYQNINISTGSVVGSGGSASTISIEPLIDGSYKVIFSWTAAASGSANVQIAFIENENDTRLPSFTGDGVSSVYIIGAQLEVGSYPSSYIPTTSATATRVVETAALTDLKTKGLIGASEGSIGGVFSAESLVRDDTSISFFLGTSGHYLIISRNFATAARFTFRYSLGVSVVMYNTIQAQNKWLFAWDASGWYLSVNGSTVSSGSEIFTFPTDTLSLSGAGGKWELNNLYSYTTKLTEDEAIQKTGFTSYEIMANELGYTID